MSDFTDTKIIKKISPLEIFSKIRKYLQESVEVNFNIFNTHFQYEISIISECIVKHLPGTRHLTFLIRKIYQRKNLSIIAKNN